MITRGIEWQKLINNSVSCRNMRTWIPFSSFFVCLQWECKFLILIYQPFTSIQTLEVVLIFAIFTGIQLIFLALSFVNVHEWKSSAITMDKTRKKFHIFYAFFFNFSFFCCFGSLNFFVCFTKITLSLGSWNSYFKRSTSLVPAFITSP